MSGITKFAHQIGEGSYFEDSVTFLIGMSYGDWNYKMQEEWRVPAKRGWEMFNGNDMSKDNNRNWRAWMYFDGMLMAADDFGNLNMAYVGCKMELPEFVYNNWITMYGKDLFWVQYGIDLAKSGS